jgi:flavin-dependent dehydrogenase
LAVGIVGGSVAGLSTAISILELDANAKVAVYEKKKEFGEPCGGAIGIYMYNVLGDTFKRLILSSAISPIFYVEVFAPDGSSWKVTSPNPLGFFVDRGKLEASMADKVQDYGGKVYTGTHVKEVHADFIRAGSWFPSYDYVVDARGLQPPFPAPYDMHHCVQIEMPTPYLEKGSIRLYFGEEVAPKGYAWIFTIQEGFSKIGLGVPLSLKLNPARLLEKFVKYYSELDYMLFKKIVGKSLQSKIIPTAKAGPLIEDGVFRVGDRALLCDPVTGGGIANAMLSGYACAKSIVSGRLQDYIKHMKNVVKQNAFRYMIKEKVLYKVGDEGLNRIIASFKGFKPTLKRFDVDFARAFTNVLVRNPKFFKLLMPRLYQGD